MNFSTCIKVWNLASFLWTVFCLIIYHILFENDKLIWLWSDVESLIPQLTCVFQELIVPFTSSFSDFNWCWWHSQWEIWLLRHIWIEKLCKIFSTKNILIWSNTKSNVIKRSHCRIINEDYYFVTELNKCAMIIN